MADFKNFNGYDVKDEVARLGISSLQSQIDNIDEVVRELGEVDVIDSQYITGYMWFSSGRGYSPNIIEIDLSQIPDLDKYNYVNLIGLGMNLEAGIKEVIAKIEIPRENGRKNLSSNYPCCAKTTSQIIDTTGDIRTAYAEVIEYFGSIAFHITRILTSEENKLQIQAFNTPFGEKATTIIKTRISTGEEISRETTYDILTDKNGSMIVSGGIGLSVF